MNIINFNDILDMYSWALLDTAAILGFVLEKTMIFKNYGFLTLVSNSRIPSPTGTITKRLIQFEVRMNFTTFLFLLYHILSIINLL